MITVTLHLYMILFIYRLITVLFIHSMYDDIEQFDFIPYEKKKEIPELVNVRFVKQTRVVVAV